MKTSIVQQLRTEISRLKAEMADLRGRRSELVAPVESQITAIEQRLHAAENMLMTYLEPATGAERQTEPRQFPSGRPLPTLADVAATDIPLTLNGRPLRPSSKRARIIRATKTFLKTCGPANRASIVNFLQDDLGIIGNEKNPSSYVSVVLSFSREIFENVDGMWRLRR